MSVTPNNTLPPQWSENQRYDYGNEVSYAGIIYQCIQSYPDNNWTPHNPATDIDREWWKPLDIYIKDETVMPHGHYSGDEEFWERDNVYVDVNGYLYLNNENTGICVKGKDGSVSISFDSLTPEQIDQIRGPQGQRGIQGPAGPEGPRGPEGYVTLTPEQIAVLKGDTGKSAYQSWLDQGYTGTESDFVIWLRSGIITLDTELSSTSPNGITNAAITNAFQSYRNQVSALVNQLQSRVEDLENRLKTIYNGDTLYFRFGVTPEGKYGYYISETSTIIPFDGGNQQQLTSTSVMRNDPQIFQNSIGYGSPLVESTLITSQLTDPTSLEGSVSRENEDSSLLYGTNVNRMSLSEAFNAYVYIYRNGFLTGTNTINFYSMIFNYVNNATPTDLLSANEENIEGIYFTPSANIGGQGSTLYIDVQPINSGDTILYEIGYYSNANGSLPSLVSGTYREGHTNGTFNSRTVLTYPLQSDKGYYFASTQQSEYKINAIYLG